MNILIVTDKKGRIQYNRARILKDRIKDHLIGIVTLKDDNINWDQYDLIYYSHFSLHKKMPAPKNKIIITSITSHKCLLDFDQTLKVLKKFHRISVNNTFLFDRFKDYIKDLYYTPNGVDTSFFTSNYHDLNDNLIFGWVGNIDRATKRYNEIIVPLSERYNFEIVGTYKKDNEYQLKNQQQMKEYYNSLDYFVVSSLTEGTPNPALEAMSCGVPVITTRVGNMVEIIEDEVNGFFVENDKQSFIDIMDKLKNISKKGYRKMRKKLISKIASWNWSIKYREWYDFMLGEK